MSILVDKNTVMIVQGITGRIGQVHTQRSLEYGMQIPAGVTPGKGGETVLGIPVFNSVGEAMKQFPQINATMILVPPKAVLNAAMDAIHNGIKLIVIITEFVPTLDALKIVREAEKVGCVVVGPNTIGVISPGLGKVGVMPDYIYQRGHIGIISRSGTLTHEVSSNLTFAGYGQSTCVCIGGDQVPGLSHTDLLELFRDDPQTELVVLLGEIGGQSEEDAAAYIQQTKYPKPVFAYIAGVKAPAGKKMGHAGAIVSRNTGTAASKIKALESAGVRVAQTTGRLKDLIVEYDLANGGHLKTLESMKDVD